MSTSIVPILAYQLSLINALNISDVECVVEVCLQWFDTLWQSLFEMKERKVPIEGAIKYQESRVGEN